MTLKAGRSTVRERPVKPQSDWNDTQVIAGNWLTFLPFVFWRVQVRQLNQMPKSPDQVPWFQSNRTQTQLAFVGLIYLSVYRVVFFKEF